jgi:DNA invertase Pin-like site-specific DNA recombinase
MTSTQTGTRRRRRSRRIDYSQLPLIGYCRTSKRGGEEGVSIEDQEHQLRAWAASQGVEIIIRHDEGRSGGRADNRAGLQDALAEIEAGRAGGIVALDQSRLGRNALDIITLAAQAREEGWRLGSLDVGLDTETPAGRLVQTIMAGFGEHQLAQIAERNRGTARHLRRAGRPRNGFIKADTDLGDLVVDLRDQGMSYRAIAAELEERGIPTVRGGITWHASSVKSIEVARRLEIDAQRETAA